MSGKKSYEEPNRERDRQSPGRSDRGTSGSESGSGSERDFGNKRREDESSRRSENPSHEPRT